MIGLSSFPGIDEFGRAYRRIYENGLYVYRLHTIRCPIFSLQGDPDNVFRRSDARLGCELMRAHGLPTSYREIEG